jgi:hypothetical protein
MAYCTKCGTKNEDDALFCKKCGGSIAGPAETPEPKHPPTAAGMPPPAAPYPPTPPPAHRPPPKSKDWDSECEEECTSGKGRFSWLWGAVIILIGIVIVVELGLKNIEGMPDWVDEFEFWWIVPVLIGIVIIFIGLDFIQKASRYR